MHCTQSRVNQLVDADIPRQQREQLPQFIEYYAAHPNVRITPLYWSLLCGWMKALEKQHYKRVQHKSDATVERVLAFLEYVRQQPKQDGALLMAKWRIYFKSFEFLKKMRHMRISAVDDSLPIEKQLRNADLLWVMKLHGCVSRLQQRCEPVNVDNLWAEYKLKAKNTGPKARKNFEARYAHYQCLFNERQQLEKSYIKTP